MTKALTKKLPATQVVKDICRATRKLHSSEEKVRIVLPVLRGEESIDELCRKEGIAQSLYYSWSKEFLEAVKSGWLGIQPDRLTLARSSLCGRGLGFEGTCSRAQP